MSGSRWQLLLRDLGAAFAFSSLLFSFLLPSWVALLFGACLLLSIFGVRPLQKLELASALLLLVFAIPLFTSALFGKIDFVIAACCFACIFSALRMLRTPDEPTNAQVNLGALLMMIGGAALTGELWYLFSLCGFATFTSISMGMSVLQHHGAKPSEMRPALYRIGMGISMAFVGMVFLFILFPRLSWKIGHLPLPQSLGAVTGLSNTVKLQSNGNIKTSPRIIARIQLKPDPQQSQLNHYWVARYYRDFDGKEWHSPRVGKTTDSQIILPRKNGKKFSQQIELLPAYGSTTLIALDRPFLFFELMRPTTQGDIRVSMTEFKDSEVQATFNATSLSYHAQSFIPEAEPELVSTDNIESTQNDNPKPIAVLPLKTPLKIYTNPLATDKALSPSSAENIHAAPHMDEELNSYKRLPENVDPRIAVLAQEILKTEKSPLKAAKLIENYLSQNLQYSLEESIHEEEPLSEFLFTKKRGHCEQFATAFAILLRQGGFASRVVAGFFGGERLGNRYILRAGDAHAWTQVYDNNLGWVSFDATPPTGRQARPNAFLAWALEIQETVDSWWRSKVVDYSLGDQTKMAKSLLRPKTQATEIRWKPLALHGQGLWLLVFPLFLGCFLYLRRRKLPPETRFLKLLERRLQKLNFLNPQTPSVETLLALLKKQHHPLKPYIESAYLHYLRWRFDNIPYESQTARKLLKPFKGKALEKNPPKQLEKFQQNKT
ncbi:MAG: transglutaminaseTgpA domain-containing protein [Cystobacterineae bacterium]|nr:transglutaminaseTgpA domain-containing protein [Cystobacterineae bacterium]